MTSFDPVNFLEIFTVYHFLLDCSPYVCFPALLTVHDSLSLHVWCIYYICETMCMCCMYQLSLYLHVLSINTASLVLLLSLPSNIIYFIRNKWLKILDQMSDSGFIL